MIDHIPDVTKMIGDTPRTNDRTIYNEHGEWVNSSFARLLENELNRSNEMFRKLNIHAIDLADRIRRLEEAGDAHMEWVPVSFQSAWRTAKGAKP